MTHGTEMWIFTNQVKNDLAATQTKMDRNILSIKYWDRIDRRVRERCDWTSRRCFGKMWRQKWIWAGHINIVWEHSESERKWSRGRLTPDKTSYMSTEGHRLAEDSTRQMSGTNILRPLPNHRTLRLHCGGDWLTNATIQQQVA